MSHPDRPRRRETAAASLYAGYGRLAAVTRQGPPEAPTYTLVRGDDGSDGETPGLTLAEAHAGARYYIRTGQVLPALVPLAPGE